MLHAALELEEVDDVLGLEILSIYVEFIIRNWLMQLCRLTSPRIYSWYSGGPEELMVWF